MDDGDGVASPRTGYPLILLDQRMVNRKDQQLQAVRDSQLVKNVAEVMFGGIPTDPKFLRNIPDRMAGGS